MENLQLNYKLDCYEGPLDLLLSLIAKNKINIYDIVIADLLDQYMEQIKLMQDNQMDIASEFLAMASRLVYIKSAMLLPKHEEEAEELKRELSGARKLQRSSASFTTLTPSSRTLLPSSLT